LNPIGRLKIGEAFKRMKVFSFAMLRCNQCRGPFDAGSHVVSFPICQFDWQFGTEPGSGKAARIAN